MSTSKRSFPVAVTLLLLLVAAAAYALPPRIAWDPYPLEGSVTPEEEATYSVTITNTGYLRIPRTNQLQIGVEGGITPHITVEQPAFPRVFRRGDQVTFDVTFLLPEGSTGVFEGELLLQRMRGTRVLEVWRADPLPVRMQVEGSNHPPVADAGPDQTIAYPYIGETVTLDGSGSSDADGDPLTFEWSLTESPEGSTATLSDSTAVNPTFTIDLPGTYTAELIVHDGTDSSAADTVTISTENSAPVADAGPEQTVFVGETVTLDGSRSADVDGDPLSYAWSLPGVPAGSTATLSAATEVMPTFVVDFSGSYVAQLIVNDGSLSSEPDTVTVTTQNSPPVAEAGPDQTVFVDDTVTLDGSGSTDADDDTLSYSWSLTSVPTGSMATLSDPTDVISTFDVDLSGSYVVQLIVNDGTVDSAPDTVTVTTQNSPPVAEAGPDQTAYVGQTIELDGSGSSDADGDALQYTWALLSSPENSTAVLEDADTPYAWFVPDIEGLYVVQLIVNDGELDSDADTATVEIFVPPDSDGDGLSDLEEEALGTDPNNPDSDGDGLSDGEEVNTYGTNPLSADTDGDSFSDAEEVAAGTDPLVNTDTPAGTIPPDPETVAPDLDRSVATTVDQATAFLYTGTTPIQTGVDEGTIEAKRAAVLRGRALDGNGDPLPGVRVTVLHHPELGETLTRLDGEFDIAVNGGGEVTVSYERSGYLLAQRGIDVPWNGYATLPDVILIPRDSQVTTVDLTAPIPMQVARGSVVTDDDGTRQATVMIPEGTTAEIFLPGGGTQVVETLNIRATEYTVGENGTFAMPAELPPTSAYTYAVELSVDEAVEKVNGRDVLFSQPVPFYVENFLGFPAGEAVPVGYYDEDHGLWVPHQNGLVIEVLGATSGLADLDVDGSGTPADATTLSELGIADAEREQLAQLYAPGQSLWRVALTHLSTWDCNWPYAPPPDAEYPNQPGGESDKPVDDICPIYESSVIQCETQTFGEDVGITGTPFSLHYSSDRVPGRQAAYTLSIPLSGDTLPATAKRIESVVEIGGRKFHRLFAAETNQTQTFTWDGRDAYGRVVQGRQPATIRVGYVYDGVYLQPRSGPPAFAAPTGVPRITGLFARQEIVLWQDHEVRIGPFDARTIGLGGWDLDIHHVYDPFGQVLYRGDGTRRSAEGFVGRTIDWIDGHNDIQDISEAPDGSLYVSVAHVLGNSSILKIAPDGTETLVISSFCSDYTDGFEAGDIGDGGPASEALICGPRGLAIGPDGSLYFSQYPQVGGTSGVIRIRKIAPDGMITTVTGTGVGGYSGDGGPAIEATIGRVLGMSIGADGGLYIADSAWDVIRRIAPDGTITTVAGTGVEGFSGDGGSALSAQFDGPWDIAEAPDGSLYVADYYNNRIRRIGPDGIIDTVAGTGVRGFSGDGGPAIQAQLNYPRGLSFGNGSLYIADGGNSRLRAIGPEGAITTIAGSGPIGDEGRYGYATQLKVPLSGGVVAAADDQRVYVSSTWPHGDPIREISFPLPDFTATSTLIASEDGSELYSFDGYGRHLFTLDALTGAVLYRFLYDNGQLASVEDGDGNITTIERDGDGTPTAIVGPYGQRTQLTVNANGYLSGITNPANESFTADYSSDGLLTRFTDPRGNASEMTYDAQGLLTSSQGAAGMTQDFQRSSDGRSFDVARTTTLGTTTTYGIEDLATGDRRRTVVLPDGTQNQALIQTNGARTTTFADGTITAAREGPDPRFRLEAPILADLTVSTPSGLSQTTTLERRATLATQDDPLSLTELRDTVTVNGRTATSIYDAATRASTITTAAGRQVTVTTDALGRPTQASTAGIEPAALAYDARGRLESITQGSGADARSVTLAYDANGYLASITDALGRSAGFAYDSAGRVTGQTFPDGRQVLFDYDAKGNLASLTPPGRPTHAFTYTAADLTAEYIPPDVGAGTNSTRYTYNLDKQLTGVLRPDGEAIGLAYESAGRLGTLTVPEGDFSYSYDPATGNLSRIAAPDGGTLDFSYDGSLLTGTTWASEIAGSVRFGYDDDFRVISVDVNGADPIAYAYDADSLLIQAGDLTLARNAQNGLLEGSTLGTVTDSWTYNSFGEPVSYRAEQGGVPLIEIAYTRDKLGRITEKTETIEGVTTAYAYNYDLAGRLVEVSKDGVVQTTWGYDDNGNRTHVDGVEIAHYDDQDRLLDYAGATYVYTANGELETKTEGADVTRYDYDVLGNLRQVTLPDGTVIEYITDGRNRRIGKKVDGTLVQGFLYQDQLKPVAELDGDANVVSRFVYASGVNVPNYMIKNGDTYRIVTDHLGSPRLVVETTTGAVVQQMNYDVWGRVTVDTNPGFQPFGFAGGLYDERVDLTRFGKRDYDLFLGRWTSQDTFGFVGNNTNLYLYVENDPLNHFDQFGLWGPLPPWLEFLSDTMGLKDFDYECSTIREAHSEQLLRLQLQIAQVGAKERRLTEIIEARNELEEKYMEQLEQEICPTGGREWRENFIEKWRNEGGQVIKELMDIERNLKRLKEKEQRLLRTRLPYGCGFEA